MSEVIVHGRTVPVSLHCRDVTGMTLNLAGVLVDYAYDNRVGGVTACYSTELEADLISLIKSAGIDTDHYCWDEVIDLMLNQALDNFYYLVA